MYGVCDRVCQKEAKRGCVPLCLGKQNYECVHVCEFVLGMYDCAYLKVRDSVCWKM